MTVPCARSVHSSLLLPCHLPPLTPLSADSRRQEGCRPTMFTTFDCPDSSSSGSSSVDSPSLTPIHALSTQTSANFDLRLKSSTEGTGSTRTGTGTGIDTGNSARLSSLASESRPTLGRLSRHHQHQTGLGKSQLQSTRAFLREHPPTDPLVHHHHPRSRTATSPTTPVTDSHSPYSSTTTTSTISDTATTSTPHRPNPLNPNPSFDEPALHTSFSYSSLYSSSLRRPVASSSNYSSAHDSDEDNDLAVTALPTAPDQGQLSIDTGPPTSPHSDSEYFQPSRRLSRTIPALLARISSTTSAVTINPFSKAPRRQSSDVEASLPPNPTSRSNSSQDSYPLPPRKTYRSTERRAQQDRSAIRIDRSEHRGTRSSQRPSLQQQCNISQETLVPDPQKESQSAQPTQSHNHPTRPSGPGSTPVRRLSEPPQEDRGTSQISPTTSNEAGPDSSYQRFQSERLALQERNMHQTSSRLLRMTDDDRPFTRVSYNMLCCNLDWFLQTV